MNCPLRDGMPRRVLAKALLNCVFSGGRRQAGLAWNSWHHPLAATGSSTTLHEAGATNWTQPEHCCPLFGWSWYFAASWVSFVCVNRVWATALVETMAPAIIGALFNSERRQMPFWMDLEGLVTRALLACPEMKRVSCEKTFCFPAKFPIAEASAR